MMGFQMHQQKPLEKRKVFLLLKKLQDHTLDLRLIMKMLANNKMLNLVINQHLNNGKILKMNQNKVISDAKHLEYARLAKRD